MECLALAVLVARRERIVAKIDIEKERQRFQAMLENPQSNVERAFKEEHLAKGSYPREWNDDTVSSCNLFYRCFENGYNAAARRQHGSAEQAVEPFDDYPDFNAEAMGCGLEDRGIKDRYDAMRYGWDSAVERVAERINGFVESLAAPPVADAEAPSEAIAAARAYLDCVNENSDVTLDFATADANTKYDRVRNRLQKALSYRPAAAQPAADLRAAAQRVVEAWNTSPVKDDLLRDLIADLSTALKETP